MSNQCIDPPALEQLELSLYIDGEADQQTIDHVAQCDLCRSNAQNVAAEVRQLSGLLFRSTCPSPEELRDYRLSFLGRSQENFVSLHTASCPHCTRELFIFDAYMAAETSVVAGGLQKLRLLVAGLVSSADPNPAFAGLRGDEQGLLVFAVDEYQLGIEFEEAMTTGRALLKGMLTGPQLTKPLAHLWQGNRLIATAPLDSLLGDFTMTDLPVGSYELIISGVEAKVRIPELIVAL